MADLTTIQLTRETHAKLLSMKRGDNTFDDVIRRLLGRPIIKAKTRLGRPKTLPTTTISSKLTEKHNP